MTSTLAFRKAVKEQEKLRLALDGPPGGGKTFTALTIATYLAAKEGGRIAVIDSERSSAKKYANLFDFDHMTLPDSNPHTYKDAIRMAITAEYAVIIIDSISHAWEGTLDLKDAVAKRSKNNDSFGAWREVTPVHNELVDLMLRAPAHVIATMRTKMEYLIERDDSTGKSKVSKVGMKPVQRDGVDYEFDVVGDLDQENTLIVSKTRCPELRGAVIHRPGVELAETLWTWLQDGEPLAPADVVADLKGRCAALPEELLPELIELRHSKGLPTIAELHESQVEDFTIIVKELESKADDMPVNIDVPPCDTDPVDEPSENGALL